MSCWTHVAYKFDYRDPLKSKAGGKAVRTSQVFEKLARDEQDSAAAPVLSQGCGESLASVWPKQKKQLRGNLVPVWGPTSPLRRRYGKD